jgi:hypothetical protein
LKKMKKMYKKRIKSDKEEEKKDEKKEECKITISLCCKRGRGECKKRRK